MASPEDHEDENTTIASEKSNTKREARQITILAPEERKTRFKTWYVYPIQLDPPIPSVVTVYRRYSDFKWLHDSLAKQYPGLFIAPLPPKKLFGNFEETFVEERRVDLERWVNRIEGQEPFHSNLAYQMFLSRPETTFKEGCKEVESNLATTTAEKTDILTELYPDLHSEEIHEEAEQDLVRIREFFERTKAQLSTVHQCCCDVINSYNQAKTESLLLHNNLSELYHVEQNYPYRDAPSRLDVAAGFQQWTTFHEKQEKYFRKHILRNVRYEFQDVEALLAQLYRVQDIQNQYTKAHKKAESWRNYEKELTEKQEGYKSADFENESALRNLLDICIKIVLLNDVENIWSRKIEAFKRDMYQYSNKTMQYYNEIADVWGDVKNPASAEH